MGEERATLKCLKSRVNSSQKLADQVKLPVLRKWLRTMTIPRFNQKKQIPMQSPDVSPAGGRQSWGSMQWILVLWSPSIFGRTRDLAFRGLAFVKGEGSWSFSFIIFTRNLPLRKTGTDTQSWHGPFKTITWQQKWTALHVAASDLQDRWEPHTSPGRALHYNHRLTKAQSAFWGGNPRLCNHPVSIKYSWTTSPNLHTSWLLFWLCEKKNNK